MTLALRTSIVALLAVAAGIALMSFQASAQTTERPYRLFAPMVASDGVLSGGELPPPDPGYCPGTTGTNAPPFPPNSIIGLLTIGGQKAPAGTIVQLVLDEKLGPAARTVEPGGYRIDYTSGASGCANQVGASISVLINGQVYPSNATVGNAPVPLILDIAVP